LRNRTRPVHRAIFLDKETMMYANRSMWKMYIYEYFRISQHFSSTFLREERLYIQRTIVRVHFNSFPVCWCTLYSISFWGFFPWFLFFSNSEKLALNSQLCKYLVFTAINLFIFPNFFYSPYYPPQSSYLSIILFQSPPPLSLKNTSLWVSIHLFFNPPLSVNPPFSLINLYIASLSVHPRW